MNSKRTAVILTTYNRPRLVHDAIESILGQRDKDLRLIIMDDGSSVEHRAAIENALGNPIFSSVQDACGAPAGTTERTPIPVTWWRGPDRTMVERKSSIPYSRTINVALNHLLRGERYICYLCDDDAFYPESVGDRADYLDANPTIHVVYGRLRSIQYAQDGFNTWTSSDRPTPGVQWVRPTGIRRSEPGVGGKRCYFVNPNEVDPQTGLTHVDEGYWEPGPFRYGTRGATDHNQVMHRTECLRRCRIWPKRTGSIDTEFWGEASAYGVGDAAFFKLLGEVHEFHGINVWTVTKKYHACSTGVCESEVRE